MKTFVEKYRPSTINEVFLEKKNKDTINYFIENKDFPNLLFYGPSGTGKTSTIIAMAREIYQQRYNLMVLELNASDNRNIQVVRKLIKEFASTKTLFTKGYKLIILDEVDSMTNDAQFALRRIMETYSDNVRFCFICNYINKIIPAIQSRCSKFKFSCLESSVIEKRLEEILISEKIEINENVLREILDYTSGDMRKILNIVQLFQFHDSKENMDRYYGLLNIPNKKFIKEIYQDLNKLKNKTGVFKLIKKIEDGIKNGFFTIGNFCEELYNLLIEEKEIRNEIVKVLSILERDDNLICDNETKILRIISVFSKI